MKLNLGCGNDIREGYVNVDFRETHPSVQVIDLSKFPWPFEDASADEILMLDFLEHFPYATTPFILLECYRVLKPNGSVVIQVPDATHLTRALADEGYYLCNQCGSDMKGQLAQCGTCGQFKTEIAYAAMRRLYGGQDYVGNFHQTCFTQGLLMQETAKAGLGEGVVEEPDYQWQNWNLKMRFKKVDLW